MKTYIIAADRIVDGHGSHSQTEAIIKRAQKKELKVSTLEIVDLAKRWEDKLKPNQFKSGASAMAALNKARKLLKDKKADVVVIKGQDLLKTGYVKSEREGYMKLYNGKYTPLDGYTKLVPPFMKNNHINGKQFSEISNALFENYLKTWKELDPKNPLPDERWYQPLTKYFRGVDCANPNIDQSLQIIVTNENSADVLNIKKRERVRVLGNSFIKLNVDGYESIPKVATYDHLKRVIDKALKEAQVDFNKEFLDGHAFMDAYTCYPVVPMALLLKLGVVDNLLEIPEFLKEYEITITGGLNLGRAAWNLTSLNSLILMREKLISDRHVHYGLVHGNGSLGNQQGITILGF